MLNRRSFLKASAAVAASPALAANAAPEAVAPADALNPAGIRIAGIRMIPVCGGKYKVWTKRLGEGRVKVLTLHGGPGFSHDYLEALESFLPPAGIELYYYDQLGSNNSDQPDDNSLWNIERFVEEVEEVRRGLGLDNFVLYGHSWGGMLAIEYALQYQQHLRGLVISNMIGSVDLALKHLDHLRNTLMNEQQRAELKKMEDAKDYDNPAYEKLMMDVLYPQMICRIQPWPEPVTRAFRVMNPKVYNFMQGKSEFEVTGNMRGWERMDRVHEIKTRTLVIGSEHDEMGADDMRRMASLMPNGKSHICPNGSHLDMWDDQTSYFNALVPFLKSL